MRRLQYFFSSRYTLTLTALLVMQGSISFTYAEEKKIEENYFVRQIADSWKTKNFDQAKEQIAQFLANYKESSLRDSLQAMLGDIHFQEGKFQEALEAYAQIQSDTFKQKTLLNTLDSLFQTQQYPLVIERAANYLAKNYIQDEKNNHVRFLVAEIHFREAVATTQPQQKRVLLQDTLSLYEGLSDSSYADLTLLPRAEIHQMLEEYSAAAPLYLELAESDQENRENYLFHAASLEARYDREQALHTFSKIALEKGEKAPLAAFNCMALLYETAQYQEIVDAQAIILSLLPSDKLSLAQFYIGKSHYYLGNYEQAASAMQKYAQESDEQSPHYKAALCMLINCADKINNQQLFVEALDKLANAYPHDQAYADALLMRAHKEIAQEQFAQAEETFQQLLSYFPDHAEKEALLHDALVLSKALKETHQAAEEIAEVQEQSVMEENTLSQNEQILEQAEEKTAVNLEEVSAYEEQTDGVQASLEQFEEKKSL